MYEAVPLVGGEEVSILPVVYPIGAVIVSSIGYFFMLVLLINLIILLVLYLLDKSTFKSI